MDDEQKANGKQHVIVCTNYSIMSSKSVISILTPVIAYYNISALLKEATR